MTNMFGHVVILLGEIRCSSLLGIKSSWVVLEWSQFFLLEPELKFSLFSGHLEIKGYKDGAYWYRGIFAQFITMREKQILARAIGIQKENLG